MNPQYPACFNIHINNITRKCARNDNITIPLNANKIIRNPRRNSGPHEHTIRPPNQISHNVSRNVVSVLQFYYRTIF